MRLRLLPNALVLALGCAHGTPLASDAGSAGAPDASAAPDAGTLPPRGDAGAPPVDPPPPATSIRELCFDGIGDVSRGVPDYDQFRPRVGSHCMGTDHQEIAGIERLVFLGDSITEGTPPTLPTQYYRELVSAGVRERFGDVEVSNCAAWGARTDDLLLPPHEQQETCFPDGAATPPTLVVMTIGGNDMAALAEDSIGGEPMERTMERVDEAIALFEDAIRWLTDRERFPNGVFVVFANVYEYTDGTGELTSCPAATLAGLTRAWPEGREPAIRMNEEMMRVAVETGTDMIFLLERFCGHGFRNEDPAAECYRGPGAPRWFDFTCIHPNPEGHRQIADMVLAVVDE